MDVVNFIPDYPEIGPNIANELYHKQEFYENRLAAEPVSLKGDLFPQQKVVGRFLSGQTPYTGLLVMHETGTGKTCAAFAAAEANRKYGKKVVFLAPNTGILNQQKKELIETCFPETYKSISGKQRQRLVGYSFETVGTFANSLSKKSSREIKSQYDSGNGTLFIVDEIHRQTQKSGAEKENYYKRLKDLFQPENPENRLKNCKVLLLSATPMFDGPKEILSVMELITSPEDFNFDKLRKNFKKFLDDDGDEASREVKDQLAKLFQGRISFMKSPMGAVYKFVGKVVPNNIPKTIKSQLDKTVKPLKLVSCFMGPEQTKAYCEKVNEKVEGVDKGLFQAIDLASMGTADHSVKYTEFVKNVGEAYTNKKKSFGYVSSVTKVLNTENKLLKGPLVNFLRRKQWKMWSNGAKSKKKRFAVIQGATKEVDKKAILKAFNSPENCFGEIISLLIGTEASREGITLKDVQQVHVLQPGWNYSGLEQVMGRAIRAKSHDVLIERLKQTGDQFLGVDIYLYAAIPNPKVECKQLFDSEKYKAAMNSLDVRKYIDNVSKDKVIAKIRYLIKKNAIDCPLFYNRNLRTVDGSRDCDYEDCNYTCSNFDMSKLDNLEFCEDETGELCLKTANFNYWYDTKAINFCIKVLKRSLKASEIKKRTCTVSNMSVIIKQVAERGTKKGLEWNPNMLISDVTILKAIDKMIVEKIPVENAEGFMMTLGKSGEKLFLTPGSLQQGNYKGFVLDLQEDPEYIEKAGNFIIAEILEEDCRNILQILDLFSSDMIFSTLKMAVNQKIAKNDKLSTEIVAKYTRSGWIKQTSVDDQKIWIINLNFMEEEQKISLQAYRSEDENKWCGNKAVVEIDKSVDLDCFEETVLSGDLKSFFSDKLNERVRYILIEFPGEAVVEQGLLDLSIFYDKDNNIVLSKVFAKKATKMEEQGEKITKEKVIKDEKLISKKSLPSGKRLKSFNIKDKIAIIEKINPKINKKLNSMQSEELSNLIITELKTKNLVIDGQLGVKNILEILFQSLVEFLPSDSEQ
jgi:hypothetical protein